MLRVWSVMALRGGWGAFVAAACSLAQRGKAISFRHTAGHSLWGVELTGRTILPPDSAFVALGGAVTASRGCGRTIGESRVCSGWRPRAAAAW